MWLVSSSSMSAARSCRVIEAAIASPSAIAGSVM
jgi:hypothetical protein